MAGFEGDIIDPATLPIGDDTLAEWQKIVDLMAELANIPAGLIMRLSEQDIEVFVSSRTEGNPYAPGERERVEGSGLYCERVIQSGARLLVPDALADPEWEDNPDVEREMISYLGYPIMLPNDVPFGTICILDRKRNEHATAVHQLVESFRDLVQHQLGLVYANALLGSQNRSLRDHLDEIQVLRGLIPICAWCKKIRDRQGLWHGVEKYLTQHPDSQLTHSICPSCADVVGAG